MRFVYFIANRLYKERRQNETMSSPMLRISITAIALGIAVMLVSLSVLVGFKHHITEKIIEFTAHIQVLRLDVNQSFDSKPIDLSAPFINAVRTNKEIKHWQRYANKPAILRAKNNLQAVILKGIGQDYDTTFLAKYLIAGRIPNLKQTQPSNEILISEKLAKKLHVSLGDYVPAYFMQKPIRYRNFEVVGIYRTYMEIYDDNFIIGDLRHIQRLNGWSENEVTGLEIYLHDFSKLDVVADQLRFQTAMSFDESKSIVQVQTIRELYVQIFDWLNMQNVNVYVIMLLMILVSATNMITGLLILILERTRFIGVLKTLGASNRELKRIFIIRSSQIIAKGMLWGNIAGIILITLQHYLKIIKLDPENYYLAYVPTEISVFWWLVVNLITFAVIVLLMVLPVAYISSIKVSEIVKNE